MQATTELFSKVSKGLRIIVVRDRVRGGARLSHRFTGSHCKEGEG